METVIPVQGYARESTAPFQGSTPQVKEDVRRDPWNDKTLLQKAKALRTLWQREQASVLPDGLYPQEPAPKEQAQEQPVLFWDPEAILHQRADGSFFRVIHGDNWVSFQELTKEQARGLLCHDIVPYTPPKKELKLL